MSAQIGNLAILGATGSVGTQALSVVRENPGAYSVQVLTARRNLELLIEQAKEFRPALIGVADAASADVVRAALGGAVDIAIGEEGLETAAVHPSVHTVLCAVVGFAGLRPTLAAIKANKHIALANKESLVAGGDLVNRALEKSTSAIVPVDSEHSSVFQCLLSRTCQGQPRRIILTASGGPFLDLSREEVYHAPPERAVRHPRWNMGPKISVDSASLMNKGLEVIEAAKLFNLPGERIEVLIHPETIVHGLAEYDDGTMLAALYQTDMRVPIAFALSYLRSDDPKQRPGTQVTASGASFLDLAKQGSLHFRAPDTERFPALALCYEALDRGGDMPTVLNAANEIAVESYLGVCSSSAICFGQISEVVARVMARREQPKALESVNDIVRADAWAREQASNVIAELAVRQVESRLALT
ncbi:MAG: 1-deoxy-D-xylulose-5-phosphate reductoisomerase [Bdellovibrionales bacterium]|nr:1-deoxy-D-xylulose-5-phosphate reductoisomerase [Bdellovibrionales bacterium]